MDESEKSLDVDDEPAEPNPEDCCGEGCSSCVWDVYRENLKRHLAKKEQNIELNAGLSKIDFSSCRLVEIILQTPDTSIYRFQTNGLIKILPGQHLEMRIFEGENMDMEVIRKYSPVCWDKTSFSVIIKRYKDGKISRHLEKVKIGEEIFWRGPYGNFSYTDHQKELLIILCIGTGIAPMVPIVRQIVNDEDSDTVIKLLCGCSTLDNRLLLNELKELAAFWNFSFVHFVTSNEGETNWGEKVERRRIQESDIRQALARPDKSFVLICGNDSFCSDMKNFVSSLGAPFYCF